jgi:hypothetical protein
MAAFFKNLTGPSSSLPHFLKPDCDIPAPALLQREKDNVFMNRFKAMSATNLPKGLKKDWEEIEQKLSKAWSDQAVMNALAQSMSKHIEDQVSNHMEEVAAKAAKGEFGKLPAGQEKSILLLEMLKKRLSEYESVVKQVDTDSGYYKKLSKLLGALEKPASSQIATGGGVPERIDLKEVKSGADNLETAINKLEAIANALKSQAKISSGGKVLSSSEIEAAINKVFRDISGEGWHEYLVVASILNIRDKEDEIFEKARQAFIAQGFEIVNAETVKTTRGTGDMAGKKVKQDVIITLSKDGVQFTTGVSAKSRLGKSNFNKGNFTTKGKVTVQKVGIGQLVAIATGGKEQFYETGWGAALVEREGDDSRRVKKEDLSSREASWNTFKDNVRYYALLRGLVGTGTATESSTGKTEGAIDFASLFWVNDKVVSMYQLYNAAAGSSNKNSVFSVRGISQVKPYMGVRPQYTKKDLDPKTGTREAKARAAISALYQAKLTVEIKIGNIINGNY